MITINLIKPEPAIERKRRLNLESVKRYRKRNPEKYKATLAKRDPEKAREANKKHDLANRAYRYGPERRYGLTPELVDQMIRLQGGVCKICQEPLKTGRSRHIDHKHTISIRTGKIKKGCQAEDVRGILCAGCNTGLGKFNDSPELLERAAEYIRRGGKL